MQQARLVHVLGNTWCIESHVTIPVYFLNDREVILLDSGYANWDRAPLDALLQEHGLHVQAILGSHSPVSYTHLDVYKRQNVHR